MPGHSALSLILQDEGDSHWAVRNSDLAADDPPVYGFVLEDEESGRFAPDGGGPRNDRLTSWVLDYTLGYSRGNWGVTAYPRGERAFRAALARVFPPGADVLGTEVYELDGVLVAVGRGLRGEVVMNLSAAYRVPAGFREFADPPFRALTVSAAPPQSRAAVEWVWTLAGDRCGGHCTLPRPHSPTSRSSAPPPPPPPSPRPPAAPGG